MAAELNLISPLIGSQSGAGTKVAQDLNAISAV